MPKTKNITRLNTGAIVTGQVVDLNGNPVKQAVVEVQQSDRNEQTYTGWNTIATDNNGRFVLSNVVPNSKSTFCVYMSSLQQANSAVPLHEFITPGNGESIDLGVIKTVPAAIVTGYLKLSTGEAIPANTRIALIRERTREIQQIFVNKDGSFTFQCVPIGEKLDIFSSVHCNKAFYDAFIYTKIPVGQTTYHRDITMTPIK